MLQNDGSQTAYSQGTPVHAFLAPEALRVLAGGGEVAEQGDDLPIDIAAPGALAGS